MTITDARGADQPHLILIGGSNILFGIDSEQLQEQIGMPTINAGLHAGLGLLLFLDIAETYAQPGDVIVLIPEYPLLSSRLYPTDECSQELIRQVAKDGSTWYATQASV